MSKQPSLPAPDEQQLVPLGPSTPQAWERFQPARPYIQPGPQDGTGSLAAYWQILLRRRWTVLAIMVVITVLTALNSFRTKPVYKAAARIEVESDTPPMQMLNQVYQQTQTDADFLRTQIEILKTDNLAWRTIEQLGLAQNPAFAGVPNTKINPETRKVQLVKGFKGQLSVDLIPGSRIIIVGFESTDPHLAARVVNTLVDNYTEYNFRQKYDATRQAAGRMEQQLDELKAKVETSQRELVDYQRKHAIADLGDKQNVIEQRLGQLSTDLTQAQNDRIEREAQYNQAKANPDRVHASAQNDLLRTLQGKQADLHSQYVEALNQYGPNYPKVVRLAKEVEDAEAAVANEKKASVDHYYTDYVAARNREQLLAQAVAQQKDELGNFNQLLVEHNILKGEFETNQQLYQKLLEHLKDATVSAGLRSTNIHIVDPALAPLGPIRPRTSLNITIGLLIGLIFGGMMAFIQEALDSSLKNPEDVEMLIAAPALASIPAETQPRAERLLSSNSTKRLAAKGNGRTTNIALLQGESSGLSEAYRALRTSILLSAAGHAPQTLLITSASAGEGKTNTAVNLALALAQCGSSVLLIDCDLRRPCVSRLLKLSNQRGMSTYLTGNNAVDEVIQAYKAQPNLSVITSGPIPPNPAELVSSESMARILQELRGRFKHIIVDSPPLLVVTDATILSSMVEGAVLVVESGVTPKKLVLRARRVLDNANARVLGVVLNKVRLHHDGYYDSYYRGYYHETQEV